MKVMNWLSAVCQTCLKFRAVNRCLQHSQVNSPPQQHHSSLILPVCLSHNTPSPFLCLHPSLHLSILSHCLVNTSVRARLVTPGEGCLALSWALFVCFFCLCICLEVGVGLGYGKHVSVFRCLWVYSTWLCVYSKKSSLYL